MPVTCARLLVHDVAKCGRTRLAQAAQSGRDHIDVKTDASCVDLIDTLLELFETALANVLGCDQRQSQHHDVNGYIRLLQNLQELCYDVQLGRHVEPRPILVVHDRAGGLFNIVYDLADFNGTSPLELKGSMALNNCELGVDGRASIVYYQIASVSARCRGMVRVIALVPFMRRAQNC